MSTSQLGVSTWPQQMPCLYYLASGGPPCKHLHQYIQSLPFYLHGHMVNSMAQSLNTF